MHRNRPCLASSLARRAFQLIQLPGIPNHRRKACPNNLRTLARKHPANHEDLRIWTGCSRRQALFDRGHPQPSRPGPHRRRGAQCKPVPISIGLHNRQQLDWNRQRLTRSARASPASFQQNPIIVFESAGRDLDPARPSMHAESSLYPIPSRRRIRPWRPAAGLQLSAGPNVKWPFAKERPQGKG
jgi:hypothetical protein